MADFLFKVFCHNGWPQVIISDQGREFVNDLSRYEKVFVNCVSGIFVQVPVRPYRG